MRFALSALTALTLSQLVAAFDSTKDSCQPEAHVFQGTKSPGFMACTPVEGQTRLAMFTCGNAGSIAYDAAHNRIALTYYKNPTGNGVVRRQLYGACDKSSGGQIAHISISTPLDNQGIKTGLFEGFNRPCDTKTGENKMTFSLYDLTHEQLQQCYGRPLKPITA